MLYEITNEKGHHYQPIVKDSLFWDKFDPIYLEDSAERGCADRLKAIFDHIKPPGTLLDIGSNIGIFCHAAEARGFKATGIENDYHVEMIKLTDISSVETAHKLSNIYNLYPELISGDYIKLIEDRRWDYVLYLSVWHHHLIGYGFNREKQKMTIKQAEALLKKVWQSTNKAMIFEMDGFIKKNAFRGWFQWLIPFHLKRLLGVKPKAIHVSKISWGHSRILWLLEKSH